jgi:two-component system nitrate/nitrite response regulator NarL
VYTVILADDSTVQLNIARNVFKQCPQFTVAGAYVDGRAALDAIKALKPTLALLDYAMPHLTGAEIIEIVRYEKLPTKCIFATSMGQKAAAFAAGVPVVIKPYSAAILKVALHQHGLL